MLQSKEATAGEIRETGLYHRLYVPAEGSVGKPLVVLVHGRAGDAQVMWVFGKALESLKPVVPVVLTPQATIPDINGFSWWPMHEKLPPDASRELRAERLLEVEQGVRQIREFIRRAVELYQVDARRIYIAGFSQGGAASATLSLMEPELFQGVGILSGCIPFAVLEEPGLVRKDVREKEVSLPPYFIAHGTEDRVIPIARAHAAREWLTAHGAEVSFHEDAVGHKVGSAAIKNLGEWFEQRFQETV